ncbi:MAG: CBS domain-containing protein [Acidobacteria bacterium]|jgi:CBS domain-containing protein|nr:CBS domain-containing protein [Acidobacteriota bacterium]
MEHLLKAILDFKGSAVHTIAPETTVLDAVGRMNEKGVGALLVTDGDQPVGMFTERDVLRRVVDVRRDPSSTKVAEVMSRELVVVHPEVTVEEAMAIMTERRCRHLPVIEGDDIVGMVSIGDLSRWMSRRQANHINDLMSYITGKYPG